MRYCGGFIRGSTKIHAERQCKAPMGEGVGRGGEYSFKSGGVIRAVYHHLSKSCQVSSKQTALSALTQYFQSFTAASKKRVGEQIARLQLCLELLQKAQSRSGLNVYQDYVQKATRSLAEAKKDNDFIYHERIPEAGTLDQVERSAGARLAKPIQVQEKMSGDKFRDL